MCIYLVTKTVIQISKPSLGEFLFLNLLLGFLFF